MEINNELSSKFNEIVTQYLDEFETIMDNPIMYNDAFRRFMDAQRVSNVPAEKFDKIEDEMLREIVKKEFEGEEKEELLKLSPKELQQVWFQHEPQ